MTNSSHPDKETAPIPASSPPADKIRVTPPPQSLARNEIPMPLCWGLLTASAAILILQIWNYLS
jgi:hypothetical protein